MRLLDAILRRPPRAARCVHIYASIDNTIVAAMHRNFAGIYYEQIDPVVLAGSPDPVALGAAFKQAFDRFSVKDANLREHKRSDWPAYRASGLRTIKEFERRYRAVACQGLNDSNAVVHASMARPDAADCTTTISFNPQLPPEDIGANLHRLLDLVAADDRSPTSSATLHDTPC